MSPAKRREDMDAFELAEAEEADRHRRAFLAATYGGDAKRARERLSIGGPSMTPVGSPGTPAGSTVRRQSLLLWEKVHMSALSAKLAEEGGELSMSPPAINMPNPLDVNAPRRGSLPIAIPGGSFGRSPSRRRRKGEDMDAPSEGLQPEDESGDDGESDDEAHEDPRMRDVSVL